MKKHRLIWFFVLAFILSWYPWVIALARGKTSGPNPLGPLVAAIIVTAVTQRWTGVKGLLSRIVRWRVGLRWYAAVLLLPLAVNLVAASIILATGATLVDPLQLPSAGDVVERFIFIFLFIGLGEETGWRGFAIQHLQEKRSALRSSLILAPIWALWHLPLMGNEFPLSILPAFIISVLPATLLLTWVYNRTNGSVLLPMLFHSTVNTIGSGLIFPFFTGKSLVALWWIYAGVWLLLSIAIVMISGLEPKTASDDRVKAGQKLLVTASL